MKKLLFGTLIGITAAAIADETLYTDNFTRPTWRIINTGNYAKTENRTLVLEGPERYFRAVAGSRPFGGKIRFSIEKIDDGSYKIGLVMYPETKKPGRKLQTVMSPDLNGRGELQIELPMRVGSLGLIIQGQGKYRNPKLEQLFDPAYRLEAVPPYQLVSGKAKPVSFVLYHNGKEVPDARLRENGPDAVHPESGATAHAYIDRGDPAPFDAAARGIKIEQPVSILYIGDSLTHYNIGHNHVDKVGYFLDKYNPDQVKVWNYACGGDDIQRIVQRLHGKASGRWKNRYRDLWSRNYDWAVIFLGHNDTKASSAKNYGEAVIPPAKQKELYRELIAELRNRGIKRIILFSSTSSNFELCKKNAAKIKRAHNRFGDPAHLEAFNRALQELAKENRLEYLDLYTEMKALPDKASLLNPRDGVHLTDRGHNYVALKTLQYLKENSNP